MYKLAQFKDVKSRVGVNHVNPIELSVSANQ